MQAPMDSLVSMLNFLSFFFIRNLIPLLDMLDIFVSMLNVLSFFFIFWDQSTRWGLYREFRCSMFWAFSLSETEFLDTKKLKEVSMLNVLSFFFIMQAPV